jgi:hypothetical protein
MDVLGIVVHCSPKQPNRLWGTVSALFIGQLRLLHKNKTEGCKSDYSPPSSAEVKNE